MRGATSPARILASALPWGHKRLVLAALDSGDDESVNVAIARTRYTIDDAREHKAFTRAARKSKDPNVVKRLFALPGVTLDDVKTVLERGTFAYVPKARIGTRGRLPSPRAHRRLLQLVRLLSDLTPWLVRIGVSSRWLATTSDRLWKMEGSVGLALYRAQTETVHWYGDS